MLMVSYCHPENHNVRFQQYAKDPVPAWAISLHYFIEESVFRAATGLKEVLEVA